MSRLCLYYVAEPERDRWVPGDRFVRPLVRRLLRGTPRPSGVDKVFINLRLGLDRLGKTYVVNLPFRKLRPDDHVAILGRGRHCLRGYDRSNKIVAGIGLMTHPSEWPTLCQDYPVVRYLQHSEWSDRIYRPYFGDRCTIWPVGIDTDTWSPRAGVGKDVDFIIYEKLRWDLESHRRVLLSPILAELDARKLSYDILHYGHYEPAEFQRQLARSRAMIFLCSHESQGIAYQEAMASGVPIFAWDPGCVQDPERFAWKQPDIPATSVPYFDDRCGLRFRDAGEFHQLLPRFLTELKAQRYFPREYIMETLTLERCARHFIEIIESSS